MQAAHAALAASVALNDMMRERDDAGSAPSACRRVISDGLVIGASRIDATRHLRTRARAITRNISSTTRAHFISSMGRVAGAGRYSRVARHIREKSPASSAHQTLPPRRRIAGGINAREKRERSWRARDRRNITTPAPISRLKCASAQHQSGDGATSGTILRSPRREACDVGDIRLPGKARTAWLAMLR